jgi:hypothetical protein
MLKFMLMYCLLGSCSSDVDLPVHEDLPVVPSHAVLWDAYHRFEGPCDQRCCHPKFSCGGMPRQQRFDRAFDRIDHNWMPTSTLWRLAFYERAAIGDVKW